MRRFFRDVHAGRTRKRYFPDYPRVARRASFDRRSSHPAWPIFSPVMVNLISSGRPLSGFVSDTGWCEKQISIG